jgi:hypothetical protein
MLDPAGMGRLVSSRTVRLAGTVLAAAAALALATPASAKPNIKRKGGQWGVLLGGSVCLPGRASCSREEAADVTIVGEARPSLGLGAELGYRTGKYLFFGAAYNLGFFDPTYEITDDTNYKIAYQNSVYGVVRPMLPVWRLDFGLDLAPGFSRVAFKREGGGSDKDYSQGFSFKIGPVIDIFISKRIFLGLKADFLLNAYRKTCVKEGDTTTCHETSEDDVTPVHQVIFGLHVGGTFL